MNTTCNWNFEMESSETVQGQTSAAQSKKSSIAMDMDHPILIDCDDSMTEPAELNKSWADTIAGRPHGPTPAVPPGVNASASGDASIAMMKMLNQKSAPQARRRPPGDTPTNRQPFASKDPNKPTETSRSRSGKRARPTSPGRPYGSPSTPGSQSSTTRRKRRRVNPVQVSEKTMAKRIERAGAKVRRIMNAGCGRRMWLRRCDRISDLVNTRMRELEQTLVQREQQFVSKQAWRQKLTTGHNVDFLSHDMRWKLAQVVACTGETLDVRYPHRGKDVVCTVSRLSFRVLLSGVHTLSVKKGCTLAQQTYGVVDTRAKRPQTWRVTLRPGSELDVLWDNGRWYSAIVVGIVQNGGLRLQALAVNSDINDQTIIVLRDSCRILPYNTMVEMALESHGYNVDLVERGYNAVSAFLDYPRDVVNWRAQLKTRMYAIPENPDPGLIIIDWDDTLFPTTHVMEAQKSTHLDNGIEAPTPAQWQELSAHVVSLLNKCIDAVSGNRVIILTNAGLEWVQMSMSTFIPEVADALSKVRIVSAREGYQDRFPHPQWKLHAFRDVIEHQWGQCTPISPSQAQQKQLRLHQMRVLENMMTTWPEEEDENTTATSANTRAPVTRWHVPAHPPPLRTHTAREFDYQEAKAMQKTLISIGDSKLERQAAIEFGSKTPNCWVKSLKLDATPSIERLTQELGDILDHIVEIVHHQGSLDLDVAMIYPDNDESYDGTDYQEPMSI